jgi:hypothetical protein
LPKVYTVYNKNIYFIEYMCTEGAGGVVVGEKKKKYKNTKIAITQ